MPSPLRRFGFCCREAVPESQSPPLLKPSTSVVSILKRRVALREMVRAEHALNMARIELERMDSNLEQLTAPPSIWSKVYTAAMYVGVGAVVASNPGATYAVANAAVIAGRYALAMAF